MLESEDQSLMQSNRRSSNVKSMLDNSALMSRKQTGKSGNSSNSKTITASNKTPGEGTSLNTKEGHASYNTSESANPSILSPDNRAETFVFENTQKLDSQRLTKRENKPGT